MNRLPPQRRLRLIALPALALAVASSGCDRHATSAEASRSPAPTPALAAASRPSAASVSIDNFTFTPATITVPAGTTVTWVNRDDVPHTVTADDRRFASGALDTDEQFSNRFTAPGAYSYYCAVHPHMTGRVIVK